MEPKEERLGLLLHDAARATRKAFEAGASNMGLSSAQWRLLVHVSREGQVSQSRLADLLEVEPISVSRLVDRMETAGWVQREPSPGDRRIRLVVLCEKASQMLDKVRAMASDIYGRALSGLPAEDRATLIRALNLIIFNLTQSDAAPAAAKDPEARP